jgi:hypothetical protein
LVSFSDSKFQKASYFSPRFERAGRKIKDICGFSENWFSLCQQVAKADSCIFIFQRKPFLKDVHIGNTYWLHHFHLKEITQPLNGV